MPEPLPEQKAAPVPEPPVTPAPAGRSSWKQILLWVVLALALALVAFLLAK